MKLFTIAFLLYLSSLAFSQEANTPVLEREVTLSISNQPLEVALNSLSSQAGFVFSYNPEVINRDKNVTVIVRKKTVRFVLNQLFKDEDVDYKVKGKYLILKRKGEKSNSKDATQIFEGYIYDSKTGSRITEASVYDKTLLTSAITNEYGYFAMEVPANKPIQSLQVSKLGYSDTLLVSLDSTGRNRNIEIVLQQEDTLPDKKLIDFDKFKPGWLVPEKLRINARNITDPVFRSFQFSLFPYLSTNRLLGGVAINDVSINTTIGYVQGIRVFEAGGLLNFVRNDVKYFQAAGLGNVIGGNVTGFQAAGIFNVGKNIKGFQAAGIFNQTESVKGFQAAGIFNLTKDTALYQAAGIFNKATYNKIQAAGIYNSSRQSLAQVSGLVSRSTNANLQVSGLVSFADTIKHTQIAGLVNRNRSNSKIQVAGLANSTKDTARVQMAGLVNIAKNITGLQLATFNFADTASGTPIGFLSFIRKGYHKLELSADETFPVNLAFRTGTYKFHTFITAGTNSFNFDKSLWNVGFGLGTTFGKPERLLFDLDFSSSEVVYNGNFYGSYHLYKLYFGIDKKLANKISLAAGITYSALLSDSFQLDFTEVNSRMPFYSLTHTEFSNGHDLKTWIGAKIALRFF